MLFLNHKFPNAPISYYFHDTSAVTHLETYAGVDMVVAQIRALFLGVGLKPSSRSILNQLLTYVSIILREEKCCSCSKCSQPGILQIYVSSTDLNLNCVEENVGKKMWKRKGVLSWILLAIPLLGNTPILGSPWIPRITIFLVKVNLSPGHVYLGLDRILLIYLRWWSWWRRWFWTGRWG